MEPTARQVVTNATVLLIGNELLSGKVREANLVELARTLRDLGVKLERVVMVSDNVDAIANELSSLRDHYDIVFTSGGVGPTHDDVTMAAVARAFGVSTRVDPTLEGMIRQACGTRFRPHHLRMAQIPAGATLATSEDRTWPAVVMRNVWVLPGLPEVFRTKLGIIRAHLRGPDPYLSRAVFARLDETDLLPMLDTVVRNHPDVEIGSYPKWRDPAYKTKVTFDARDQGRLNAAVDSFLGLLPANELSRVE